MFLPSLLFFLIFPQIDPLSAMGSLNLGGSTTSHTQNMQGFPSSLSSAFSNPQSPAKAFPPLTNPNPSTAFGGIGSLSSQLPGMDSGTEDFHDFVAQKHNSEMIIMLYPSPIGLFEILSSLYICPTFRSSWIRHWLKHWFWSWNACSN